MSALYFEEFEIGHIHSLGSCAQETLHHRRARRVDENG